jgi:hypothetical protein
MYPALLCGKYYRYYFYSPVEKLLMSCLAYFGLQLFVDYTSYLRQFAGGKQEQIEV